MRQVCSTQVNVSAQELSNPCENLKQVVDQLKVTPLIDMSRWQG
jgi:hypothetical protein